MDLSKYRTEIQQKVKYIEDYQLIDEKGSLEACDQLENFGKLKQDHALIGYALFSRGNIYYLHNKTQPSMANIQSSIVHFEKIQEWGYVAIAMNLLGIISLNRGNAPEAMNYYLNAIDVCQGHSLPNLEAVVNMNIATLYLNINDCQKAITHLQDCYNYLREHSEQADYIYNLSSVYVSLGKAYLELSDVDVEDKSGIYREYLNHAEEYANNIMHECLAYLPDTNVLEFFCFQARLYNRKHETEKRDQRIAEIDRLCSNALPILDLFEDFYKYLDMLIDISRYDEFFKIYDIMDDLIRKAGVKNLERRLLTLKIRYYKKRGEKEEYQMAAVLYFEVSELLEQENRLTVRDMIEIRNSNNELTADYNKVARENVELHRRSEVDPLTGIYNRFMLNEYSEKAFRNAMLNHTSFAIEILDIDYFKQFNDNYGHQNGDECIKFIANSLLKLQENLDGEKEQIFCSRYGGDEFVIIYEGFSEADTYKKAEQLKNIIVERGMEHKYSLAADIVTISQGICWDIPKPGQSAWDFLHTADTMLYEVKEVSRNSIRLGRNTPT